MESLATARVLTEGNHHDRQGISGTLYTSADPVSVAVYSFDDRSYEVLAPVDRGARAVFVGGNRFVAWTVETRLMLHDRQTGRSSLLAEPTPGHRILGVNAPVGASWVTWVEQVDE